MFGQDREQLRRMYLDTWQRARSGAPLSPLEEIIAAVIREHPEYHRLLEDESALARDWTPEDGEENPFLHMGMHIAIREQVAVDRPAGIREAHHRLAARHGDAMGAEHRMMECLGEALWAGQRAGREPDEQAYLACVRRQAGLPA